MNAPAIQQALDGATIVKIAPDMSLVDNGRRPAPELPRTLFGPAWHTIEQVADETSTAPDYAAIALLSVVASLVGGKRKASPYGSAWEAPAILWMAALGDPSSRKSAPLGFITKPLEVLQRAANEDHAEAKREWEAQVERAKVERDLWKQNVKDQAGTGGDVLKLPDAAKIPDEPPQRRFTIADCTPEAAAYVAKANPQGTLAYNDELAGWLEGFDRYNAGGRPFWLQAFEGKPFSVTRKGDGSFDVPYLGISVLGSIQPDRLVDLLAGANDGLVPRLIWAWPEKRLPSRPSGMLDLSSLQRAYERLELLPWGKSTDGSNCAVTLPFSASAANLFEEWDRDNSAGEKDGGSLYETFAGKMSGAVVRLSLVSELVAWAFGGGAEPQEISDNAVLAAIEFVEDYAKPMAARVFGDAAVSKRDRNAALLARHILKNGLKEVNARELRRTPHKSPLKALQAGRGISEALEDLCDAGWIREDFARSGGGAGRQRQDYIVNETVFEVGK